MLSDFFYKDFATLSLKKYRNNVVFKAGNWIITEVILRHRLFYYLRLIQFSSFNNLPANQLFSR